MMYGENPPTPLTRHLLGKQLDSADLVISKVEEILNLAKTALDTAKSRAQQYANNDRREVSFEVGSLVLLNTKNLKLRVKQTNKLLPKFIGPLEILQRIGPVAYRLQLPPKWKVHDVFHVSLLKQYVSRGNRGFVATPPVEWLDDEPLYEVEQILKHADVKTGKKVIRRFLLKWTGYDTGHNSWEREDNLVNCDEVLEEYWTRYNASAAKRPRTS